MRYVLVGDDFRFGARRAGDYAMLDAAGSALGFDVARMMSYEVHGLRVSSSAVREALAAGDLAQGGVAARPARTRSAAAWPTAASSGASSAPRSAAPATAFARSTCACPTRAPRPRASSSRACTASRPSRCRRCRAWACGPTIEKAGRVLLETHCLAWPEPLGREAAYGRLINVELVKWLHEERNYGSLEALAGRHRGRRGRGEGLLRTLRSEARGWILRLRAGSTAESSAPGPLPIARRQPLRAHLVGDQREQRRVACAARPAPRRRRAGGA